MMPFVKNYALCANLTRSQEKNTINMHSNNVPVIYHFNFYFHASVVKCAYVHVIITTMRRIGEWKYNGIKFLYFTPSHKNRHRIESVRYELVSSNAAAFS